jgi:hypothetical protein
MTWRARSYIETRGQRAGCLSGPPLSHTWGKGYLHVRCCLEEILFDDTRVRELVECLPLIVANGVLFLGTQYAQKYRKPTTFGKHSQMLETGQKEGLGRVDFRALYISCTALARRGERRV